MINRYNLKMEVLDIAESFTGKLSNYNPFPDLTERITSLHSINDILYSSIIQDGEETFDEEFPRLRATDYMRFRREGNRAVFEADYFHKRHMLNRFVMAELTENRGRFLDRIIDGIFSICEESSWCLPAHNTYIRDAMQLILPDADRPVLDLFACETGELLSMILYLMSDRLDSISILISKRIQSELRRRIITPFLIEHFWWMGNGDEPMCNWTPWCTQNVMLCAFLDNGLDITEKERHDIFIKSAAAVDFFLKEYGEDGCCDEGAQYYKHAGLCLYGCLEVLNGVSNDAFESLYSSEKIKNIATYISKVHVNGPWYFNFSDCSPKAGRLGVREYLFGIRTKQAFLSDFAAEDFVNSVSDLILLKDESIKLNLYYLTQTCYYARDILDYVSKRTEVDTAQSHTSDAKVLDAWFESVGLMILHGKRFDLAIKAGDNNDSHNHNDTGSITLYKNGQPILVDIGVETYNAKTFSGDRYSIWTMQSGYHNLPTINGMDELAGASYCASNVSIIYAPESKNGNSRIISGLSMNLETAFPEAISSKYYYKRNVVLNRSANSFEETVILRDETDSDDVILNFITYYVPKTDDNDFSHIQVGDAAFDILGASAIEIETLPITDARLQNAWDHDLYRIRLKIDKNFQMKIS